MEKIFFNQKATSHIKQKEYIKECLDRCIFKPGDIVKLKGSNNLEMIIESINVVTTRNYDLDFLFLENKVKTIWFNKSTQKFDSNNFSEEVLIKINKE